MMNSQKIYIGIAHKSACENIASGSTNSTTLLLLNSDVGDGLHCIVNVSLGLAWQTTTVKPSRFFLSCLSHFFLVLIMS